MTITVDDAQAIRGVRSGEPTVLDSSSCGLSGPGAFVVPWIILAVKQRPSWESARTNANFLDGEALINTYSERRRPLVVITIALGQKG